MNTFLLTLCQSPRLRSLSFTSLQLYMCTWKMQDYPWELRWKKHYWNNKFSFNWPQWCIQSISESIAHCLCTWSLPKSKIMYFNPLLVHVTYYDDKWVSIHTGSFGWDFCKNYFIHNANKFTQNSKILPFNDLRSQEKLNFYFWNFFLEIIWKCFPDY